MAAKEAPAAKETPAAKKPVAAAVITIKDFEYKVPGSVAAGSQVMVVNSDSEVHTVSATQRGAFDAKAGGGGGKATFKAPAKAGTFPFDCQFHADMTGKLVVR